VVKIVLGLWMVLVTSAAFLYLPPAEGFRSPESARIIVFHVPCAVVAAVAFVVSALFAVIYLARRRSLDDMRSAAAVEIGLVFAVLAMVTGSIFAEQQWGAWWSGDPREVSMVVLILIYAAYMALRASINEDRRKASVSAVYVFFALPAMIYLVFILPRITFSLHPSDTISRGLLGREYAVALAASAVGFLGIAAWMFSIRMALSRALFYANEGMEGEQNER